MAVGDANVVPTRVATPEEARDAVAEYGAAITTGLFEEQAAIGFGAAMLGERCVRIGTQIEVTTKRHDEGSVKVSAQPADARGRKRMLGEPSARMVAHNDGYGFGDYAPDYLFLWCERPAGTGGDSFLIDGLALLTILAGEPENAALASFAWTVDIDHSEPHFPVPPFAPIARRLPGGRVQVRHHPYQAPVPGPDEEAQWPLVRRWSELVHQARDTGPMFRAEAGDLICIDNYRVLHGRDGYTDDRRKLASIWGWSTEAITVPQGALNIVEATMEVSAG